MSEKRIDHLVDETLSDAESPAVPVVESPEELDSVEKTYATFRTRYESFLKPLIRGLFSWTHANVVTAIRGVPGIAAGGVMLVDDATFSSVTTEISRETVAAILFSLHLVGDAVDGMIARALDQTSQEGAALDPLMDKVANGSVLGVMIGTASNVGVALASAANIAVDIASQRMRGPLVQQIRDAIRSVLRPHTCQPPDPTKKTGANVYGKLKFGFQSAGILSFMLGQPLVAVGALTASFFLGLKGVLKRRK